MNGKGKEYIYDETILEIEYINGFIIIILGKVIIIMGNYNF